MTRVPRRRFFAIDRHKLADLNGIEKVNCTFCNYANGLISYIREVAARTEPPLHAEPLGEHVVEADSMRVIGSLARCGCAAGSDACCSAGLV